MELFFFFIVMFFIFISKFCIYYKIIILVKKFNFNILIVGYPINCLSYIGAFKRKNRKCFLFLLTKINDFLSRLLFF